MSALKKPMVLLLLGIALSIPLFAQVSAPAEQLGEPHESQEVAESPSLSANDINAILQREPALMLQVKRLLIHRAHQQGRVLLQSDLTDDAVYELMKDSPDVRAMATNEIVKRNYLPLRPTRDEWNDYNRASSSAMLAQSGNSGETGLSNAGRAPGDGDQTGLQGAGSAAPSMPPPAMNGPVLPSIPQDGGQLPAIPANDLPTLLAASSKSGEGSGIQPIPTTAGAQPDLTSMLQASELARGSNSLDIPAPATSRPQKALPHHNNSRDNSTDLNQPNDSSKPSPSPYANVPSLYDLYSQASERQPHQKLARFGADIFKNGSGNANSLPMDLPVGPDYVIGPGDGLSIELWGAASTRLQRVVDRTGRVALPEVGLINVSGHTLRDAQTSIQSALRTQFRDIGADVSLTRIRSVRVYVVGDVVRPGAYDISSLSTPLNAIYQAGGPTDRGSIRMVRHYRGKQLVQEVDLYSLILQGVRDDMAPLEDGDTIVVPPSAGEVRVEGMVRRPAIYELHDESNLADVLALAGGVLPTGTLRHIEVERIESHVQRVMLNLDVPDGKSPDDVLKSFKVQEGDVIRVSPILPYTQQTVYLDGHVYNPGKFSYHKGMTVAELLHSYANLLPEPSRAYAEVIRLQAPDFRPEVMAFNLGQVLDGKANIDLQPFDTVRVFGRYDFQDPPEITVNGEVRSPGKHLTNGQTHLRDAIYLAGGLTPDAQTHDVQVFRRESNGGVKVMDVNLAQALAGAPDQNILLLPQDRVIVQKSVYKADPALVQIQGEVLNPGRYPLGQGMTAAELVRMAGGFKRSAFTEIADLSRNPVQNGESVVGEHQEVQIGRAMSDHEADVALRDGDTLTIRQLSGWNDIGAAITIKGEVQHPGTYGIREGDRLSSVLERAGGYRSTAYPRGAILDRVQVREFAEKSRAELVRRIEAEQPSLKIGPGVSASEEAAFGQAFVAQRQQILKRLQSEPISGRQVIAISGDINKWRNTPADIEVRAGDVLFIPKQPNFVLVSGQVFNPSAISYTPGKNAGWYLKQAGGVTDVGNKSQMFIVRADGSVVGDRSGLWSGGIESAGLQPGDVIVVPEKVIGGSSFWKNMLATAQIATNLAISAQLLTGL